MNRFTDCEKSLAPKDFSSIEQDLGIFLPSDLKGHYLKFNGGTPEKSVWRDPSGEWDENEVRDFFPFLYFQVKQDDPDFTINGRAKEEWAEGKLPKNLLPFAIDWGGNYFCLDLQSGGIFFFLRDVWSENLSREQNWAANTRFVTDAFGKFVDGLEPSEA